MKKMLLAAAIALAALPVQAAIVVDKSVDVLLLAPGFNASNSATGQNFLVQFTLSSNILFTGASIYSEGFTTIGTGVTVKFRNDVDGAPDSSNLVTRSSTLSLINSNGSSSNPSILQQYASFAPVALSAGTYWFGMSGAPGDIGWNIDFASAIGGPAWQLAGDSASFPFGAGTALAFRLYDGPPLAGNAVPEPAGWSLLIGGFAATGAAMRLRRRRSGVVSA